MDWMYKGVSGHVDREEYLIGRKIDKTFELIEKEENPNAAKSEEECALINQLATNSIVENLTKNDLTAKMREDPLFVIQQKKQEQRKEILHNPVKLKHIQELLKSSLKKDKKQKRSKKDKKKTSKKSKHKSNKKRRKTSDRNSSSESDSDESDPDRKISRNARDKKHENMRTKTSKRTNFSSSEDEDEIYRRESQTRKNHRSHQIKKRSDHRRSSSNDEDRRSIDRKRLRTDMEPDHRDRVQRNDHRDDISRKRTTNDDHHSPSNHHKQSINRYHRERNKPVKAKLSEDELRKRREEMMNNAVWRERERSETVKKFNEKDKEEQERLLKNGSSGAQFIKPMLSDIASTSSIGDSIRTKKFTSQRGPSSMETNFARR